MAKYNNLRNNFLGGEVSPRAFGRTDLDQYRTTCEKLENMIVLPQGGVSRRPGTEFIATQVNAFLPSLSLVDLTMKCRLIPYIRSSNLAFAIVIRENTDASQYAAGLDPDISIISLGSSLNVRGNGTFGGNRTQRKLVPSGCGWIEDTISALPWAVQFAGYTATQLDELKFTVNGDYIVVTHPQVVPLIIQYMGGTSFVAYPFNVRPVVTPLGSGTSYISGGTYDYTMWPFRDLNTNASHTLAFGATTGSTTCTSSVNYFDANLIGAVYVLSSGGWFEITAVTNATSATVKIYATLGSASATANWRESAWSNYRGWPRCATFHQGRLIYGGNLSKPQHLWGAKTNDIFTLFNGNTGTTDPLDVDILTDDVSSINWLISGKNLNIGTGLREIIAFAPDSTLSIGPGNIDFSLESASGSAYTQPVKTGNAIMFLDRDSRSVREFVFNFQEDSFRSDVISTFAEHMPYKSQEDHVNNLDPKIIRMAFQSGAQSTIWFVDNNGGLFGCTRVRELSINAWHYHKIAGNFSGETTIVEDVCILPNKDGTHDDVWLIVKRSVNGIPRRMIERMPQLFKRPNLDYEESGTVHEGVLCYCDAQWTDSNDEESMAGTPITAFTWFDHLVGESVAVIGDGKYYGLQTVGTSGTLTTPEAVSRIVAGLPYRGTVITTPIEAGSVIGSGQTGIQRNNSVVLRFNRTVEAQVGIDIDNLRDLIFRENTVVLTDPTPMFTGIKYEEIIGVYSRDTKVTVVSDSPFPFELTSVSVQGTTYD